MPLMPARLGKQSPKTYNRLQGVDLAGTQQVPRRVSAGIATDDHCARGKGDLPRVVFEFRYLRRCRAAKGTSRGEYGAQGNAWTAGSCLDAAARGGRGRCLGIRQTLSADRVSGSLHGTRIFRLSAGRQFRPSVRLRRIRGVRAVGRARQGFMPPGCTQGADIGRTAQLRHLAMLVNPLMRGRHFSAAGRLSLDAASISA